MDHQSHETPLIGAGPEMLSKANGEGAPPAGDYASTPDRCEGPRRLSPRPRGAVTNVGFLLFDGFVLLAYSTITEMLRAANELANAELYCWHNITEDGDAVRASTGMEVVADGSIHAEVKFDLVFVLSGPTIEVSSEAIYWLRRKAREDSVVAGIASGAHVMAAAGLLHGHRCAIHWSHAQSFCESFPEIEVEPALYVIDGKRLTCSGSGAAAELTHALIEAHHGPALAQDVDEWLVQGPRPRTAPQRQSTSERVVYRNPPVLTAVARMEADVEKRLTREELARSSGVTVGQLERLFRRHLGTSISSYYREIRLKHAGELLRRTGLSVEEVALASGFSSHSYFSRVFKAKFGAPPATSRHS